MLLLYMYITGEIISESDDEEEEESNPDDEEEATLICFCYILQGR